LTGLYFSDYLPILLRECVNSIPILFNELSFKKIIEADNIMIHYQLQLMESNKENEPLQLELEQFIKQSL